MVSQAVLLPAQADLAADANRALQSGDYDRARQIYTYALRLKPRDVNALTGLARWHWTFNEPKQAERLLTNALKINPKHSEALTLMARLSLSAGNEQEARAFLERAVASDENNGGAQLLLANVVARSGNLDLADKHFRKVLDVDPRNLQARLNVVSHLAATGKLQEAIKLCEQEIVFGGNEVAVAMLRTELGALYLRADRYVDATNMLKTARSAELHDSEPFQLLTFASGAGNDWTSALGYAKVFGDFDQQNVNAIVLAGWAAYAAGDLNGAKSKFEEAVALQPDNAHLRNLLAMTLADLRHFTQAMEESDQAIATNRSPMLPEKMTHAMLLMLTGKTEAAENEVTKLVSENPEQASVMSLLSYANLLTGKDEPATDAAAAAIRKDPNDVLGRIVMARLLCKDKEYDLAVDQLQQAARTGAGGAFLQCELAATLIDKGDYKKAAEAAQFALQIAPSNPEAKLLMGRALAKQGNWDGALIYLRENAARNPKDLRAKMELIEALIQARDFDAAELACMAAIKLAPKSPEPLRALARVLSAQGNRSRARKLEKQANNLNSSASPKRSNKNRHPAN